MPAGQYKRTKLLIQRPSGRRMLKVFKTGPFFECYLDEIMIGRCKQLTPAITPAQWEDAGESCLKLPNYVILLSVEEEVDLQYELTIANELKNK